jgi:hypothetical protein
MGIDIKRELIFLIVEKLFVMSLLRNSNVR